jgi:Na+/melibiose symporter-like transporter
MQNTVMTYLGYGTILTLVEIVFAAISVSIGAKENEQASLSSLGGILFRFYVLNIIFIIILSNIPAG